MNIKKKYNFKKILYKILNNKIKIKYHNKIILYKINNKYIKQIFKDIEIKFNNNNKKYKILKINFINSVHNMKIKFIYKIDFNNFFIL